MNHDETLWNINDLIKNHPSIFSTEGSVRHMIRNRIIPIVRFTPRGKIFFDPEEIHRWIKKHRIKEQEVNK